MIRLALSELVARLRSPALAETLSPLAGTPCVVVDLDVEPPSDLALANCPVIALVEDGQPMDSVPDSVDVPVAGLEEAERLAVTIAGHPIAAMVLVRLLRHNQRASVADGLFAESLAYSSLQHGAEFRAWLAARKARPERAEPDEPATLLQRDGDRLRIVLNRPHKRNAYSAGLRDALCEALALAVEDASVRHIQLEGSGACFSAGGDLDEFGEARDAGIAHASRLTRSAGALIHRLRDRVEARLHGACIGAGIELPAFAKRVVARQDAFFQLPEVGMGLIPGAGGTVSILPRIGRGRLAYMALSGERIDAATALDWGLVDAIADW